MKKKKNTFDLLNFPPQVIGLVFTFSLILLVSPYFEGLDFGIFKVPNFSLTFKRFLQFFGPPFFIFTLFLFFPLWKSEHIDDIENISVESSSKYRIQSISDIVKNESSIHGININGIKIGDRFTINDLENICSKVYYPNLPDLDICNTLRSARAKAFTVKYADPGQDEKLVDISQINIEGLKEWDEYFKELAKDLKIDDFNSIDVLNVGIGNGHADHKLLKNCVSSIGVDISTKALEYARAKLPNMSLYECAAEDMNIILNSTIDLYLSFRTYQSSLFDRRASLHEAYRVLRNGGIAIVSIPIMYLKKMEMLYSDLYLLIHLCPKWNMQWK